MEKYVNNDTLKEDDITKLFKDSVTCPLCKSILIDPYICLKCQKAYCKQCLDKWKENNKTCPNNCNEPEYTKCLGKKDILSKFKFICVGCENEIEYNNAENHHNTCCPGKTSAGFVKNQVKIKKLTSEEVDKLRKEGNQITYITSKKLPNLIIYIYSNNIRFNESWKIQFN
jgi:carboxypeptidase C (cathepsin A)